MVTLIVDIVSFKSRTIARSFHNDERIHSEVEITTLKFYGPSNTASNAQTESLERSIT